MKKALTIFICLCLGYIVVGYTYTFTSWFIGAKPDSNGGIYLYRCFSEAITDFKATVGKPPIERFIPIFFIFGLNLGITGMALIIYNFKELIKK